MLLTRGDVVVSAIVLAFLVVGWEQWVHASVFGVHADASSARFVHWLRDGSLTVVPSLFAVGGGLWVADRLATPTSTGARLVLQAMSITALFSLTLVPMVGVHNVVDAALGGSGGLGSLRAAPGAGYLDVFAIGGIEGSSGFFGVLWHGARDAVVSLTAVVPGSFVAVVVIAARTQRPASVGAPAQLSLRPTVATPIPVASAVSRIRDRHQRPRASITRRELFKYGGAGTVAFALSSAGVVVLPSRPAHAAEPEDVTPWLIDNIELFINDGQVDMIDGTPVYMWGYGFRSGAVDDAVGLHTPGPVIWTYEGETVELTVTNNLDEDHSFVIDGVYNSGRIGPGQGHAVSFAAPEAGTYLYQDDLNGAVNRVLGLQGVMIVMPRDRSMRLHESLDAAHWTYSTQWVWIFNEIDPSFNAKAHAGLPIDAADFKRRFKPRYFTINGRMGSFAVHSETAPDTVVHDTIGNPALIRIVNGGLAVHSPHVHGNHVYVLGTDAAIEHNILWKDTVMVLPEQRKDVFLPFAIPPNAVRWPPDPAGVQFLAGLHGRDIEGAWPMHCHVEMSQTAAGGLYPQGLLTDWAIDL